jgi:hypothetical protein
MSDTQYFFLASSLLIATLLSIFAARGFRFDEISIVGQKLRPKKPIEFDGARFFYLPALALALATAYFAFLGIRERLDPASQRAMRYAYLEHAELQASQVDDFMFVTVNGRRVISAKYGDAANWVDVTGLLRRGPNTVEVIIQNGRYGGCGGRLVFRINGVTNSESIWQWGTAAGDIAGRPPNVVCFQEVRTINLD